jgi:hypothetical protein
MLTKLLVGTFSCWLFGFSLVSVGAGQSEQFDTQFLLDDTFAVLTINVDGIAKAYSESPSAPKAVEFLAANGVPLED